MVLIAATFLFSGLSLGDLCPLGDCETPGCKNVPGSWFWLVDLEAKNGLFDLQYFLWYISLNTKLHPNQIKSVEVENF